MEVVEQDNFDLRAERREKKEFDSKSNKLHELANDFYRVPSQKRVTLAQLEIEAARKIFTKDNVVHIFSPLFFLTSIKSCTC